MLSETEEWRTVPGYEHLEASSLGNVRCGEKVQRQHMQNAYRATCNRGERLWVHRLVCAAFHGPPFHPNSRRCQANHKNGNKLDNRPENLEWVTSAQNTKHAFDAGLIQTVPGERNGSAKLTDPEVIAIRNLDLLCIPQPAIAKAFGITQRMVSLIVNRENWKHLP